MDRSAAPHLPPWIATMLAPGTERYVVDVGGMKMHVAERGTGIPVLMLHGNPTWGFLWRKVAAELDPTKYRCIMPDLIGLGLSDKPHDARAHTIEAHARWIGALVDQLALASFILVVQDWGGAIGFRMAAERAAQVRGLVVLNTAIGPPKKDFKPTAFHRFARTPLAAVVFRLLHFPQVSLGMAQGDRKSIAGKVTGAYVWPLRRWSERVAPLALARMVPDSQAHPSIAPLTVSQGFVQSFRGPAAIVWGDKDPVLGRLRRWVEQNLPQASVSHSDAGHFIQEERPREIAEGIRRVAEAKAP